MSTSLDTLDRWWRVVRARATALVAGRRLDADVEDELAFHAAMAQAEAEARGASPADARLEARRRLDGAALRRDECRDARGLAWLDGVRQDLRHAFRGLRRTPIVTATALLSLGLGLGATAALFAVVDAVVFKSLPFPEADRIVWIEELRQGSPSGGTPQRLADWARLDAVAAAGGFYADEPFVRTGGGDLGRLRALRTFGALLPALGVTVIAGRLPTAREARADGAPVVLLTEHAWRTRFAARADVIGMPLRIDRGEAEVIGVLPASVEVLGDAELWMPAPPDVQASTRAAGFLGQVARLAPGRSIDVAQTQFATAADRLTRDYPDTDRGLGLRLMPLRTRLGQDARRPLLLLLATVGLVLLVASLNVASLMLARGLGRLRDGALRVAIGAGRARLLQLHLLEAGLLAAGGAALGVAIAPVGLDLLRVLMPDLPTLAIAAVDWRLVGVTAGLAIACALIVGLLPALLAWRLAAAPALRDGGATVSGAARSRWRGGLVVGQVAIAVVLLSGAGLLARALAGLTARPLGFEPGHTLTFSVPLPWDSDPARIAGVTARVLDRLQAAPGVRAAGVVDRLPLGGGSQTTAVVIPGVPLASDLVDRKIGWRTASAGYFGAIGLPLRRGQIYDDRRGGAGPRIAVVNEAFVRAFLGARDPIGLEVGGHRRGSGDVPVYRIVGVVGDLPTELAESSPMPAVYVPAGATFWPLLHFAVRADGEPESLVPVVRALGSDLAPDLAVEDIRPLDAHIAAAGYEPAMRAGLVAACAGVALLLAAIGLYGLLAGEVAASVKEIGIRLALGAAPRAILGQTLRRGLLLTLSGVALGAMAAPLAGSLLESLLAGRSSRDGVVFGGAVAVLLAVALLASLGPAWRAARIDPNRALRVD